MAIKDYRGKEFSSISIAVMKHIDGSDHEYGQLEEAAETANNAGRCIGNLIELLFNKGIITEDEIKEKVLRGLIA